MLAASQFLKIAAEMSTKEKIFSVTSVVKAMIPNVPQAFNEWLNDK